MFTDHSKRTLFGILKIVVLVFLTTGLVAFSEPEPGRRTTDTWLPFSQKFLDNLFLGSRFRSFFGTNTYEKADRAISLAENLFEREFIFEAYSELEQAERQLEIVYATLRGEQNWPRLIPSYEFIPPDKSSEFLNFRVQQIRTMLLRQYFEFRQNTGEEAELFKRALQLFVTLKAGYPSRIPPSLDRFFNVLTQYYQSRKNSTSLWLEAAQYPGAIPDDWWGSLWLRQLLQIYLQEGEFSLVLSHLSLAEKRHPSLLSNAGRARIYIITGNYTTAEGILLQKMLQLDPKDNSAWRENLQTRKMYIRLLLLKKEFEKAALQYRLTLNDLKNLISSPQLSGNELRVFNLILHRLSLEFLFSNLADESEKRQILEEINSVVNLPVTMKTHLAFYQRQKVSSGNSDELTELDKTILALQNKMPEPNYRRFNFQNYVFSFAHALENDKKNLDLADAYLAINAIPEFWLQLHTGFSFPQTIKETAHKRLIELLQNPATSKQEFFNLREAIRFSRRMKNLEAENAVLWSSQSKKFRSAFIRSFVFFERDVNVPEIKFEKTGIFEHDFLSFVTDQDRIVYRIHAGKTQKTGTLAISADQRIDLFHSIYSEELYKEAELLQKRLAQVVAVFANAGLDLNSIQTERLYLQTDAELNFLPWEAILNVVRPIQIIRYLPGSVKSMSALPGSLLGLGTARSGMFFGLGRAGDELDDISTVFREASIERNTDKMSQKIADSAQSHLHLTGQFTANKTWRIQFAGSSQIELQAFFNFQRNKSMTISSQTQNVQQYSEWEEYLWALGEHDLQQLYILNGVAGPDYRSSFLYDFYSRAMKGNMIDAWFAAQERSEKSFSGELWHRFIEIYAAE
ncbi:MAG: hypothetical protein KDK41_00680 [Leptospiraceae bacterium]|nr:hypothetical protein [Leptospiraceae bacterium]